MAKGPLIDIEALVKPIPRIEEHALREGFLEGAGDPALFDASLRDELDELRREDQPPRPGEQPASTPPKKAEWKKVEDKAKDALATKAKDLRIVGYLTEAMVKQYGLAGMRDGLALLRRLCEVGWERLYPDAKEELDNRFDPVSNMFDGGARRGVNIPDALLHSPMAAGPKGRFSVIDFEIAQRPNEAAKLEAFNQGVQVAVVEICKNEREAIVEARAERDKLYKQLQTRYGNKAPAPGFVRVREALEKCDALGKMVWSKIAPPEPPPGTPKTDNVDAGAPAQPGKTVVVAKGPPTRDELYKQLGDVAQLLGKMEPHSPIPYLIQRCVDLGKLAFPDMIKELIKSADAIKDMNVQLGIKEKK